MLRIWIPAIIFLLVTSLLVYPDFLPSNTFVLWKLLLLIYRGNPGPDGISDLWFAFTVMALYIISPFFYMFMSKLTRGGRILGVAVCLTLGLIYRLYTQMRGMPYLTSVYLPLYGQLDFFIGGVFLNGYIYEKRKMKCDSTLIIRIMACFFVAIVFLFGFYATWMAVARGKDGLYYGLYSYFGPTMYSLATMIFIYAHSINRDALPPKRFCCISYLAKYGFEFYLFHSLILARVSEYLMAEDVFRRHIKIMVVVLGCSLFLSSIYHAFTVKFECCVNEFLSNRNIDNYFVRCLLLFLGTLSIFLVVIYIL